MRKACCRLQGRHERARTGLYVHDQTVDPFGEFLTQDTCRDQWNRLDSRGHVAQRVDPPVCRGQIICLPHNDGAGTFQYLDDSFRRRFCIKAGDRLQLVECSARVSESTACDHRHRHTASRRNRRNHHRGLVSNASCTVLIDLFSWDGRQVQNRS